jgi:hypothetical protein
MCSVKGTENIQRTEFGMIWLGLRGYRFQIRGAEVRSTSALDVESKIISGRLWKEEYTNLLFGQLSIGHSSGQITYSFSISRNLA